MLASEFLKILGPSDIKGLSLSTLKRTKFQWEIVSNICGIYVLILFSSCGLCGEMWEIIGTRM